MSSLKCGLIVEINYFQFKCACEKLSGLIIMYKIISR